MGHTTDLITECEASLVNLTSATGGISSALEHITTLARKIEQRLCELDEKEEELRKINEGITSKHQELARLELELNNKGASLNQRDRDITAKEERWDNIEKRMSQHAAKLNAMIQLNVGGQNFATSKTTLLEHKGSFFEALLTSDHSHHITDSSFFIDRDPKYFPAVLNYLRDGKFRNSDLKGIDVSELMDEFAFFNIPFPHNQKCDNLRSSNQPHTDFTSQKTWVARTTPRTEPLLPSQISPAQTPAQTQVQTPIQTTVQTKVQIPAQIDTKTPYALKFEGGTLLSASMGNQIEIWIPGRRFSLIYKALRDGFESKDYHTKCDNKGPTLTIIQSKEGFLFGGFAPDSVDSSCEFKHYPNAFIFTLTNPHAIPPTQYHLKHGCTAAVFCLTQCGAVFGDSDIRVENSANFAASKIFFPACYFDTTKKGKLTFTGTRKFYTKDIEVFSVI